MTIDLSMIRAAAARIASGVSATPVADSPKAAQRLGLDRLVLKLENLQQSGSFKARGALNRLSALSDDEKRRGVVAMSAGNHAQGVALQCGRLGIPAAIVMPKNTPAAKIGRTRAWGARVMLEGDTLAEAEIRAHRLAAEENAVFVHPYDDEMVIAGQGTVGLEWTEQAPLPDTILIPIGGGGLAAGCAVAIKALSPHTRLIGVQSTAYPSMVRDLTACAARPSQTLAEGIAVKSPGGLTKPIIESLFDDVVAVEETYIEQALVLLMEDVKIVAEGAGAAPLAAVMADPARFAGQSVGVIVSGGNIDNRVTASILMRGLVRDGRLARLRVEISDQPGALGRAAGIIADAGGNILEVHHQRLFQDVPVKSTDLEVSVEAEDSSHIAAMLEALNRAGIPARILGSTAALPE